MFKNIGNFRYSIIDVISKYEKLPIADGIVEDVDFAHENVCIYLKKAEIHKKGGQ